MSEPRYLPTLAEIAAATARIESQRLADAPDERSRPRLPHVYREPRGLLDPTPERID